MKKDRLRILFEDKNILIVYKDNNLLTISTDNVKDNTLYSKVYSYIKSKNKNNKFFIVHRLDRDTCGLVLFAKNESVKKTLQDNWNSVIRKYYAVTHGKTLNKGKIRSFLKETKTLYTYSSSSGKEAITEFKTLQNNNKYSLIDINLITGRKNQIRVHMKDNNTPIVGDKKYGIKDNGKVMCLCAYYLKFNHPVTKEIIEISINIPSYYKEFFK